MQLGSSLRWVGVVAFTVTTAACGSKKSPDSAPSASAAATPATSESAALADSAAPAPSASASAARYAISGPASALPADPRIARQQALRDAKEYGLLGALNASEGGVPAAPTSVFGRDDSLGDPSGSARGNMWGDEIGDAYGGKGLGLTAIGEGGGGRGEGIGLGSVGVIGHGSGAGTSGGYGRGEGSGRLSSPKGDVRVTARVVSGSLPVEVVQRIVRSKVGAMRLCYEAARKSDPKLAGEVSVDFTITSSGATADVKNPGAASEVGLCITKVFASASFPQPEGGPCNVSASVTLTPPDGAAAPKSDEVPPSPVADPSTTVDRIHGQALDAAQPADVAMAMRDAGCTDVSVGTKNGVSVITAKYKDADVTVTFAPANGTPVPADEMKRLRGAAVVLERLGMFLAIEGPHAIADALKRAIVVATPLK